MGRMEISNLTKIRSRVGDAVQVSIIRDRKPMTVRLLLGYRGDSDNLIPDDLEGEQAEYLLHGGLLIRELTGRYLQAGGGDWRQTADPRLTNLYLTRRMNPEKPGDKVVILSVILPDPVNVGYQEFMNSVVMRINGQPVRNMRDVFRIFDADGGVSRVTLKNVGVDLVLDPVATAAANERISRNYGIPALQYRRQQGKSAGPQSRAETP
jgi:hypothetical protein